MAEPKPPTAPSKIFFLSPARMDGQRARLLFNPASRFPLASRLQGGASVPLGEIFSFLSGLYFRGKLTYASRFAAEENIFVITPNQGLLPVQTPLSLAELATFTEVPIDPRDPRYRRPLELDLAGLAARTDSSSFILLGSIATKKYVQILQAFLGPRLYFPLPFLGLGDMSRGALLLRQAAAGEEMNYAPLEKTPSI